MKTVEVYIVKEDDFSIYKIKNIFGVGFNDPTHKNFIIKVNDETLLFTTDYNIQENEIIFNKPLLKGDKIEITDSILNNVKIVTKNSYNKNALFKIFSSDTKFKLNHTYDFNLNIRNKKYNINFSTKYDPFYTTVKKIRLDTGDLLNNTSDKQIAALIYQHSKDVADVLGDDADTIPVYASNVVRYKTDIDLCWAIYLSVSGKYGTKSKKIGTIEIGNSVKVPYVDTMVKRFKELLTINEELLNSDNKTSLAFIKAGSTDYPLTDRGDF